MGQIAEDMADGSTCSDCGMYFQDPKKKNFVFTHDYPVICKECWETYSEKEKKDALKAGLQIAIVDLMKLEE
jgi:hydrogenase maturation factor HypF (carbamoyltransferase family)